jgi:hypothetical protein
MKDSEFIELLNLYLDHEISPADAARLEAEVQSNAARRRTYQDYCRMQKACKMLAQDFATETDEAEEKVVAFEQARATHDRRRTTTRYVVGGMFAAAACVALVFVGRQHTAQTSTQNAVAVQASVAHPTDASVVPVTLPTSQMVAATGAAVNRDGQSRTFGTLGNSHNVRIDAPVLASTQDDPHFAWLQDVRLTPIQAPTDVGQLHLNTNSPLRADTRNYPANKPLPSDVQWTAIRFQK